MFSTSTREDQIPSRAGSGHLKDEHSACVVPENESSRAVSSEGSYEKDRWKPGNDRDSYDVAGRQRRRCSVKTARPGSHAGNSGARRLDRSIHQADVGGERKRSGSEQQGGIAILPL